LGIDVLSSRKENQFSKGDAFMADSKINNPKHESPYVCEPKFVKLFDNFLRPFFHDTDKLFGPFVTPGMTALDVGCGRGFASMGLAKLVGTGGRVVCADLQTEMLDMVKLRAKSRGVTDIVSYHSCQKDRIGVTGEFDFANAFWMVHEVPDQAAFIAEIFSVLKPGGRLFVAEPIIHTSQKTIDQEIAYAENAGFKVDSKPKVAFSRAVVFVKP
jgi:ubiquinone/menaquinone biosynthesis C-methylase UbiE